jgi:molybdopterin-binding protein
VATRLLLRLKNASSTACCNAKTPSPASIPPGLARLRAACAGPSEIPLIFSNGLFKEKTMSIQAINVRNQFKGKIKEIIRGDVVSEIDVETPWGIVTSVITTRSVDDLALKVGSEVVALVKSTEVSIAKL